MVDVSKGRLLCCGPMFFVCASFILSQFASKQCHYATIPDGSYLNERFLATDLGIWCYTIRGGQEIYYTNDRDFNSGNEFDRPFYSARGFSIASTTLGAIVLIVNVLAPCCAPLSTPKVTGVMGVFLLLACVCESCTFLFFRSDAVCNCSNCGCSLGVGGKCGVAASVLYFVSSVLTCGLA
eukprot:CAMPEP_0197453328 /NCGR_PEP_ID=MMETSP1175-20131217/34623_1 /TAXON_ID=1003142 /ORGANISM="Triceratium dubium, Strain CCMP147" /LENGTH=180 /DNA_ID=CAMNT_0042986589 /DNA_START=124 /DNA_END=662 /DNA_ORIENTATION=+